MKKKDIYRLFAWFQITLSVIFIIFSIGFPIYIYAIYGFYDHPVFNTNDHSTQGGNYFAYSLFIGVIALLVSGLCLSTAVRFLRNQNLSH